MSASPPPDVSPDPVPGIEAGADSEWDELTLATFGPRYWNIGCG